MSDKELVQLPINNVPAAWADADIASGEEIADVERSKQPEDIIALPMFLLTEIEEIETTFGTRYKYFITTPDGEQWNFTLGASAANGAVGKLTQARIDMYEKFRAQPKSYVFALETVHTKLGQDGYRFTSPVQKLANAEAAAGRRSQHLPPPSNLPQYDTWDAQAREQDKTPKK